MDTKLLLFVFDDDSDDYDFQSDLVNQHSIIMGMMMMFYEEHIDHMELERLPMVAQSRLCWETFWNQERPRIPLRRHLRMEKISFYKLLSFLYDDLYVNEAQANRRG
jgi:hypothetical protein